MRLLETRLAMASGSHAALPHLTEMIQCYFLSTYNVGTLIEIHTIMFGSKPTAKHLYEYSTIISKAHKK